MKKSIRYEAPEAVVAELQALDALQSCRIPFFTFKERAEQLEECMRIRDSVAEQVLSTLMREIVKARNRA